MTLTTFASVEQPRCRPPRPARPGTLVPARTPSRGCGSWRVRSGPSGAQPMIPCPWRGVLRICTRLAYQQYTMFDVVDSETGLRRKLCHGTNELSLSRRGSQRFGSHLACSSSRQVGPPASRRQVPWNPIGDRCRSRPDRSFFTPSSRW